MKLHLPKRLFTALLTAITLAAAPAALTLGSTAWGEDGDLNVPYGGNLYAGNYAFTFTVGEDILNTDSNTTDILALYWGVYNTNNLYSNGYTLTAGTNGDITLTVGDGQLNNAENGITENTTFIPQTTDNRSAVFNHKLEENVTYTIQNIGANQKQTVLLYEGGKVVDAVTYNGNMNGTATALTAKGNSTYEVSGTDTATYCTWNGNAGTMTDGANWGLTGDATIAGKELLFTSSGSKTVTMSGDISAASMVILDAYTFNAAGDTTLNVTNSIAIGTGKSMTFSADSGSTVTLNASIYNNGTLVLKNTLGGDVDIKNSGQGRVKLGDFSLHLFNEVTYSDGDSGFVKSLKVFTNENAYTGDVYIGNTAYTVSNGSVALNGTDKTYYVFSDKQYNNNNMGGATGFYIAGSKTLMLDDVLAITAKLIGEGNFKYNLDTYKNDGFYSSISLDTSWSGTVKLAGYTEKKIQFTKFNNLSNGQSWLETTSVQGYLWNSDNFTANLSLFNGTTTGHEYALRLNDGSSPNSANVTFSGKIKGTGDIWYSFKGDNGVAATHTFSNDLSGWEGEFIRKVGSKDGKNVTAKFTSGGAVFHENGNGGVRDADDSNRMFVVIDTSSNGNKATTFNGAISGINTLTVTTSTDFKQTVATGTLAANDNTSFAKSLTVLSTATVASEKNLTLKAAANSIGTLNASSGTVTLTSGASLTLGSGAHSIGTLSSASGTSVSLNSGANLTLTSVNSVNGTIGGEGTLTLSTGGTIGGIPVLFGSTLNELVLTNSTCLEITSATSQPERLDNITTITVASGATFGNRLTGKLDKTFNLSIAGNGNGSNDASGAALAIGRACDRGGTNQFGSGIKVSLADDATIWVNEKGGNNTAIVGQIDARVQGNDHTLTKTGLGTLNLQDGAENTSIAVNAGVLKLSGTATTSENVALNGGTLKLGDAATINSQANESAAMTKVSMSSSGISTTATDGTKGSMANADVQIAQLAADASFTIADMTLTNTTITAATVNTKVDLKNIDVTNVTLEKGAFTVGATPVVGTGEDAGVITYSASMGLGSTSASLTLNLDVVNAVAGDKHGVYTLVIELGNFDYGDFSAVEGGAWTTYVGFQEGSWLAEALSNAPAALTEGGAPTVSYGFTSAGEGSNVGMLTITINGLNVPEPTTSTLSLLALAGLCARRRRKM